MDGLLMDLLPRAEELSGLQLFPTYSYFRVYHRGDVLGKHTDRQSCEISLSLCLGYQGEKPWPLMVEGPGGSSAVALAPGDALLYRGIECPHCGASRWKASAMLRFSYTTSIRMVLTRNGNTISDPVFRSRDHGCRRRGLPTCYGQNNDLNRGR